MTILASYASVTGVQRECHLTMIKRCPRKFELGKICSAVVGMTGAAFCHVRNLTVKSAALRIWIGDILVALLAKISLPAA